VGLQKGNYRLSYRLLLTGRYGSHCLFRPLPGFCLNKNQGPFPGGDDINLADWAMVAPGKDTIEFNTESQDRDGFGPASGGFWSLSFGFARASAHL